MPEHAMHKRLNIIENPPYQYRSIKQKVIGTFENFIVRLYCQIRFIIIPLRMMDSIAQLIPHQGRVLDLGCGFGLFSLYFAIIHPNTHFIGIDLDAERIRLANKSVEKLGLTNIRFIHGDARTAVHDLRGRFNLVFSIDLFHHIPTQDGDQLAGCIYQDLLAPDGMWVVKDVSTRPRLMLYFTFLLDWLMNPRDSFYYRNLSVWRDLSKQTGYASIETFEVWDILPYPHFIMVARKQS